jgi:hypothetical protein
VCAKPASLQNVMKVIVKILNFVRPNVLNHREFQTCLSEPELEYGEVIYFSDVPWLSSGKMLKRVFDLREAIRKLWLAKESLRQNSVIHNG